MKDKDIIDKISKMTKNIDWYIEDKNKERIILRGKVNNQSVFLALVYRLLDREKYWEHATKGVAHKLGEVEYLQEFDYERTI